MKRQFSIHLMLENRREKFQNETTTSEKKFQREEFDREVKVPNIKEYG